MPIKYQKWITRADLQANPDQYYVFGDNLQRKGLGGQAKAMRNEPNSIGIVTKLAPNNYPISFLSDNIDDTVLKVIEDDLNLVEAFLKEDHTIVWPEDGIGTGLSKLPTKAPKIWDAMELIRFSFEKDYGVVS